MLEIILSIAAGIGLSAACGFRIFLPFTVLSAMTLFGGDFLASEGLVGTLFSGFKLSSDFSWVASWPAFILLGTATVIEIGAFYIPWVDNLLDTIAMPVAVIAGAIASMTVLGDVPPAVFWTTAAIAGGTAGSIQVGSVATRAISSATTGGLGNFLVSTIELVGALVMSLLALIAPFIAIAGVAILLLLAGRALFRRSKSAKEMQLKVKAAA